MAPHEQFHAAANRPSNGTRLPDGYDQGGAAVYISVVVVFYGMGALALLISSRARKRRLQEVWDNQADVYFRQMDSVLRQARLEGVLNTQRLLLQLSDPQEPRPPSELSEGGAGAERETQM